MLENCPVDSSQATRRDAQRSGLIPICGTFSLVLSGHILPSHCRPESPIVLIVDEAWLSPGEVFQPGLKEVRDMREERFSA